ncbi:MAG: ATP-binding protein [bacterium]|nr:ATP-binding protein [bacterium]
MMEKRRFQIQSAPNQFVKIYPIIADMVEELKLEGNDKFRFAVCISEAFTNAFYHGNHADPNKIIELIFCWDSETLSVEIGDQGQGTMKDINLNAKLESISPEETCGRGVAIINSFADNLEVIEKDGGGLKVKMSWHRQPKPDSKPSVVTS